MMPGDTVPNISIKVKALIDRDVLSAEISAGKDIIILHTLQGDLYLSWVGDCCAHCYIAALSGAENLIDAKILSAENAEWKTIKDDIDGGVTESMGTKIKTSKGYVTIESRVEHNGYYGGRIKVSKEAPIDNYDFPIDISKTKFKPLKDFE